MPFSLAGKSLISLEQPWKRHQPQAILAVATLQVSRQLFPPSLLSLSRYASCLLRVPRGKMACLTEHHLPARLCQSRMDQRCISNACTVIAMCMKESSPHGVLQFQPDSPLQPDCLEKFVAAISKGNKLHDNH